MLTLFNIMRMTEYRGQTLSFHIWPWLLTPEISLEMCLKQTLIFVPGSVIKMLYLMDKSIKVYFYRWYKIMKKEHKNFLFEYKSVIIK